MTICMSFSAQVKDTFSQFFSASEAPDEISSASRSLTQVHAVGFAEPAGLDQRHAVHPEQEIVQRLAELAGADVAEMR